MDLAIPGTDTKSIIRQLSGMPAAMDADTAPLRAEQAGSAKRIEDMRAAKAAEQAPVAAKIQAKNEESTPEYKPDALPDFKPPQIDSKQMQETLGLVTALAAMGGLLTRTPLTTALTAFSGGVQGMVQGNQEVYKRSMDEFKANFEKAKVKNDELYKQVQSAREKHKTDIQGLTNELSVIAAKYEDQVLSEMVRRGDITSAINWTEKKYNMTEKAMSGILKIEEMAQTQRNAEAGRAEARADRRAAAGQASADRRAIAEGNQGTKGWQVFQNADGSLVRVNAVTGEREDVADSKGLFKPKAGGSGAGGTNTRNALVQASGKNAIDRLNELKADGEGQFPTTSVMFGQHGDGVTSRVLHAAGQKALSTKQQKIDAGYASLVDEAIPVFTGGLRGSDAFRKFLLGQVPQPGDDEATANEKMRLFEANIKGTLHTFGGAFQANPGFHAEGGGAAAADNALTDAEQAELDSLRAKHGRK